MTADRDAGADVVARERWSKSRRTARLAFAFAGQRGAGAIEPATRVLVWLAIVACVAIVAHVFFRFIGRAPYVAVDDALANVSVNLANHGRYGFPASPIQALTYALRLDEFLNYGPWPFLLGAALDWLFGTSYAIQRSAHLLAWIVAGTAFIAVFRRTSVAAIGAFVVLSLTLFWRLEWPMVRPDHTVAMFGALAIASATFALRENQLWAWGALGFTAASAATTHPIALSLIPWAGLLWGVSCLLFGRRSGGDDHSPLARPVRSLTGLVLGGAAGSIVYLVAVRFRIADVVTLWRSGAGFIETLDPRPFGAVAARHFDLAWSLPRALFVPMAIGFAIAFLLAAAVPFLRFPQRHVVWALLAPPVSLALAYQLSLGGYGNYHAGYATLSHVSTAWAVAACVGAIAIMSARLSLALVFETGARAVAVLLLLFAGSDLLRPISWSAIARSQVDFDRYMREVLALFPDRASVWAGLSFGLASGTRLDLVEFSHGAALAFELAPDPREAVAPDFLVINDLMRHVSFAMVHARSAAAAGVARAYPQPLDYLPSLFPRHQYGLVALVDAPPYGTTRVYAMRQGRWSENAPMIAVNNGSSPQWTKAAGAPIAFAAEPVDPVVFRLSFYQTVEAAADRSRLMRLPSGTYLIGVAIDRPAADRVGLIAATPGARFVGTAGDLGFGMAQAPYFHHERLVHVIVRHSGGPLYVSQFDADPDAGFAIASVQPIEPLQASRQPIPQPALSGAGQYTRRLVACRLARRPAAPECGR